MDRSRQRLNNTKVLKEIKARFDFIYNKTTDDNTEHLKIRIGTESNFPHGVRYKNTGFSVATTRSEMSANELTRFMQYIKKYLP